MSRYQRCTVILILYGCIPLLAVFLSNAAWRNIITSLLLCALSALACRVIKRRCNRDMRHGQVAVLMTAFAVIAVVLYLFSGVIFGFSRVVLLASLVFVDVIPFAAIIISCEILRSVLISQNSRGITVWSYVLSVFADVFILSRSAIDTDFALHSLIAVIFPAVFANLLYHYVSSKYGALPNILYRIILTAYPYFVPLHPQMPEALLAVARMILPIFVLSFIYKLYQKRRREAPKKRSRLRTMISAATLVMSLAFIMLVSGVGRYKLLVIGSESMSGVMDKGDAVVYEKYTDQTIREGQIILFERDGIIIVHRVLKIETLNGKNRYYTKGDANDAADVGYVTDERIVGISAITLKYIGYPAVWARDLQF